EQVTFLTLAAGVADHPRRSADERDRPVASPLKSSQHQQRQQTTDMQAFRGRIKSRVHRARFREQPRCEICVVGGLMNEPAPTEIFDNIVHLVAFHSYRHMSSSAKGWAGPVSFGFGNAFRACSANRRSSFVVIFRLMGEPVTMATFIPSRST